MFLLYCAVGNVIPPTQNIHNNINISQYREEGRNETENTKIERSYTTYKQTTNISSSIH